MLNISIQHQYPVLMDTYKNTVQYVTINSLENLQEIEERYIYIYIYMVSFR